MAFRVRIRGMRLLSILLMYCCTSVGQSLSIGVTGGGRPTDDLGYAATPESRRYVAGPMLELGLPFGMAIEVDSLYHRNTYRIVNGNFAGYIVGTNAQIPGSFRYFSSTGFPFPSSKPFVEAGFAPRTISGTISESGVSIDLATGRQTPFSNTVKTNWSASLGVVAGGGVQFGIGHLRLSPEVRYTHWTSTPINGSLGDGRSFASNQEQVDFLIGIGWKLR
jgi:hypothetical protein